MHDVGRLPRRRRLQLQDAGQRQGRVRGGRVDGRRFAIGVPSRLMRWMRAALLLCAAATACQFSIVGFDTGSDDMATGGGGDFAMTATDMASCACATGCADSPTPHCLAL